MRTFKCLGLSLGHLVLYATITLLPDVSHFVRHPVGIYLLAFACVALLVFFGLTIIRFPMTHELRHANPTKAYIVLTVLLIGYTLCLASTLMLIAHFIPQRHLHELGVLMGNVGITFAVLIVYDNMEGAPIKDTYNELMSELDDIERASTSCALDAI